MKKKYRIKKNEEFQKILNQKKFFTSKSLVIYLKQKEENQARIGITVSKKMGNAVKRNKIKRQIRSMCQSLFTFDEPFDCIIMVRKDYVNYTFEENKQMLQSILKTSKGSFNSRRQNV